MAARAGFEAADTAPLAVRGLTVAYHREPVLQDVTFTLDPGRLVAVVGPNGAGKSTLLHASLGLLPRAAGEVALFGQRGRRGLARVAFMPQTKDVDWDFPVRAVDVVAMGLYRRLGWFRRVGKRERHAAHAALERVGMGAFAQSQIGQLSGGQRQRVFLARALVQDADLYVMDEPFAGVDAETEAAILALLVEIRDTGATALVVHHDLVTVARTFADIVLLDREVVAVGPTREVFTREALARAYGGTLVVLDDLPDALAGAAP